jgi:DNA-binding CsgD family transcriptional regulator
MDINQNYENIIAQAKNVWTDMTKTHPEHFDAKLFDEVLLDLLSQNSNTVFAAIGLKDYRKLYLSRNVKDIWGYSVENNSILGILQYVKMMSLNHALFPIIAGKWYIKCLKSVLYEDKTNQKVAFVGAQFKTSSGQVKRTFIQTGHLEEDHDRNPINIINSIQDISHFMKDDFWWGRYAYGDEPQKVKCYHSTMGKHTDGDIISDREKDILRLIHQGLDSPEIADKLCLSLATVHTHRKNMLARTGMKDITGLLHVALSIGMI